MIQKIRKAIGEFISRATMKPYKRFHLDKGGFLDLQVDNFGQVWIADHWRGPRERFSEEKYRESCAGITYQDWLAKAFPKMRPKPYWVNRDKRIGKHFQLGRLNFPDMVDFRPEYEKGLSYKTIHDEYVGKDLIIKGN